MATPMPAASGARLPLDAQVRALRRIALAAATPGGPALFETVIAELAGALGAAAVFVAVFADPERRFMRTRAAWFDGIALANFVYELATSPCARVTGTECRFVPSGIAVELPSGTIFKERGMDSYAALPLVDRAGAPLGLVVAMDRLPIADGDAEHAETILKIAAGRLAAEIERERADEALKRSEASYRAIFEAAEDAIFIHDWETGRVLDVNPKACSTYGWSREELVRLSVADISAGEPPYTAESALDWIGLAKQGRCPPFEWHRRNKDGSLHWDEVRLKPTAIDGKPHILAFTREITEHKNALAALQAREEQYRAIFDASADSMVLCDRDLRIVDTNHAFTRLTGYSRGEFLGVSLAQRPPDIDGEKRVALLKAALAGREGQIVSRTRRKDGAEIEIEVRYLPVLFGGERYVLAVGRDVSERVERERALARSEARLRATVEAAFDCIVAIDGEGRVVEFNAAAERVFGHRRADVLGKLLSDLILPHRHREAHARGIRHFHASGRGPMIGRLVEATALRADGTEIPVEFAISVAAVPEGSIFVGHLRDISARRAAEEERAGLEAQLRQSQKMEAIGQLTGGIAHDFNNILTSIVGYVVLAQERAESLGETTIVRQLGLANQGAQRARDLIGQMLAFARRRPAERRVFALGPVVRQTLELLRSTLPTSIAVDCAPLCTTEAQAGPRVAADPVQLEQVIFNLCINARDAIDGPGVIRVRAGPNEGGWTCASCRTHVRGGRWIELSVADSGAGVPPEVAAEIFQPFVTTKPVGQGSGMGLAMVDGIVHGHGGHVRFESRPGEGSVFRVLLPAVDEQVAVTAAPTAPDAAVPKRLEGRVLVVEDDAMAGDFLVERLANWGLAVTLERDPRLALTRLENPGFAIDLVLTDQTMPSMTGTELAARAQAIRPGLPIVLVSANAAAIDPEAARLGGVRRILAKPVAAQTLKSVLAELLAANA